MVVGERLADDRQASDVRAAVAVGDAMLEQAGLAERGDQAAAFAVEVAARIDRVPVAPGADVVGQRAMPRLEERPGEERRVSHQSPWNSGVRLAANAS